MKEHNIKILTTFSLVGSTSCLHDLLLTCCNRSQTLQDHGLGLAVRKWNRRSNHDCLSLGVAGLQTQTPLSCSLGSGRVSQGLPISPACQSLLGGRMIQMRTKTQDLDLCESCLQRHGLVLALYEELCCLSKFTALQPAPVLPRLLSVVRARHSLSNKEDTTKTTVSSFTCASLCLRGSIPRSMLSTTRLCNLYL